MIVIKNGRKMEVGPAGVSGSDIIKAADPAPGRIAVAFGGRTQIIDPNKHYLPENLRNRRGTWFSIEVMPDRSKGAPTLAA